MRRGLIVSVILVWVFFLSSCLGEAEGSRTLPSIDVPYSSSDTDNLSNGPEDTEKKEDLPQCIDAFSEDDFIIRYQDILISDKLPFDELARQLGLAIDDNYVIDSNDVNYRAGGWNEDLRFTWYQIYYPSKLDTAMIIDYVVIDTEKKAWLVMIDVLNSEVSTYRGIRIGDSEQKFLERYGDSYTRSAGHPIPYYYIFEHWGDSAVSYPQKEICIEIDTESNSVDCIFVDYGSNYTMEMLDIPTLGY